MFLGRWIESCASCLFNGNCLKLFFDTLGYESALAVPLPAPSPTPLGQRDYERVPHCGRLSAEEGPRHVRIMRRRREPPHEIVAAGGNDENLKGEQHGPQTPRDHGETQSRL